MKRISICEFKKHFSSLVAEAAAGRRLLITKHRNVVATLSAAEQEHLTIGSRAGKVSLRPLLRRGSRGRYLKVLLDDRYGTGSR